MADKTDYKNAAKGYKYHFKYSNEVADAVIALTVSNKMLLGEEFSKILIESKSGKNPDLDLNTTESLSQMFLAEVLRTIENRDVVDIDNPKRPNTKSRLYEAITKTSVEFKGTNYKLNITPEKLAYLIDPNHTYSPPKGKEPRDVKWFIKNTQKMIQDIAASGTTMAESLTSQDTAKAADTTDKKNSVKKTQDRVPITLPEVSADETIDKVEDYRKKPAFFQDSFLYPPAEKIDTEGLMLNLRPDEWLKKKTTEKTDKSTAKATPPPQSEDAKALSERLQKITPDDRKSWLYPRDHSLYGRDDAIAGMQELIGMPKDKIDGKFGPGTEDALKKFQKARGMKFADGIVGPETAHHLKIALKEKGQELAKKVEHTLENDPKEAKPSSIPLPVNKNTFLNR